MKKNLKKLSLGFIVISALLLTGCLSIFEVSRSPEEESNANFFTIFRETRQADIEAQLAILHNMITNETLSQDTRILAEEQKLILLDNINFSLRAETLIITTLNFQDAIVSINDENIHVLIQSQNNPTQLQADIIISILEIVKEDKIYSENVFISVVE